MIAEPDSPSRDGALSKYITGVGVLLVSPNRVPSELSLCDCGFCQRAAKLRKATQGPRDVDAACFALIALLCLACSDSGKPGASSSQCAGCRFPFLSRGCCSREDFTEPWKFPRIPQNGWLAAWHVSQESFLCLKEQTKPLRRLRHLEGTPPMSPPASVSHPPLQCCSHLQWSPKNQPTPRPKLRLSHHPRLVKANSPNPQVGTGERLPSMFSCLGFTTSKMLVEKATLLGCPLSDLHI